MKRAVDLVVLSDIHLGTYGCKAKELLQYLESIQPKHLILNGDIIDMWAFKKSYFPESHLQIIKKIFEMSRQGIEITYITGNHDEMLRKFTDMKFGGIKLLNKLLLDLDGKKTWIFHGDVFDTSVQHSKWLAKFGGWGYDKLIQLNNISNWLLQKLGKEKYSFSKKIKNSVKKAIKFIADFEEIASDIAISNGYDTVICGHIHQPQIREIQTLKGRCLYLNSGDWIENLTALEYHQGQWKLYAYETDKHNLKTVHSPDIPTVLTMEVFMQAMEVATIVNYKN